MHKFSKRPELSLFSDELLSPTDTADGQSKLSPKGDTDCIKERTPLTVSELNQYVTELFSTDSLLRNVRVQGELSGVKRHSSGHLYFSLKDETALVRCVMFRQQALRLAFQPQDGMRVVLTGNASLYVRDGMYQLYALTLQKQGEGELYQQFLALKVRLEAEGYFDLEHKNPIPFLPKRIGVVTSGTGAAVQDIIQIIQRRFPSMPIVLAPVRVQGNGAAEDIARAIVQMNQNHAADVLIVGRGGGSMEDLWAFNELPVAKAIYESKIPIVSAVGHETDFTIADFVADLRAPTPSAAAELTVPKWDDCVEVIHGYFTRFQRGLSGTLLHARSRVKLLAASHAFFAPKSRIATDRQMLDAASEQMTRCLFDRLRSNRASVSASGERVAALSPMAVLGRGYALIRDSEGHTYTDIRQLEEGQQIRAVLHDGCADAVVTHITAANTTDER
ncbi:MAG: exodeoxyribonuclease VII large subunit [Clostridia bacterium]